MERDDPYLMKNRDTDGDNEEYEKEIGEDGHGKYVISKSKEKDEEGKSKKSHKIYVSEKKDVT